METYLSLCLIPSIRSNAGKGADRRSGESVWNSPANRPAGKQNIRYNKAQFLNCFLLILSTVGLQFKNWEADLPGSTGLSSGRLPAPLLELLRIIGMRLSDKLGFPCHLYILFS